MSVSLVAESENREPSFPDAVKAALLGRQLIVVANRQPYIHKKAGSKFSVMRPASGLVTALEPIMRVSGGGVWVGHGCGDADRESVDGDDEVNVPPEHPTYKLRRVWLTEEEERGYYYGFSNEGIWPLCHLAFTRPVFRMRDWEMYKRVNERFAEAALRKAKGEELLILVQDYHYALLPRLIRDRAPGAAIGIFWHIPWPNPESFGVCPRQIELLEGMLGAGVVGFHTQSHCNNFLDTCDRFLECRVDRERFSVVYGGHETLVRSYPISIATEEVPRLTPERRRELRERYGIRAPLVAVGVDRLDYTKGLIERVEGVERFLEKYPEYLGRFSFVEVGTPSRESIGAYRSLVGDLDDAVARVNARFAKADGGCHPVIFLKGHFDWAEVAEFYQLGGACLVTSLHDGMNLVAKEYVWSQSDEEGALVLSRFTGAARELTEAIQINPYSSEEVADAIHRAFTLPLPERIARMRAMKDKLKSRNAFHWAMDLLAGVASTV
jgi:trehalose 6-phosphate synthase